MDRLLIIADDFTGALDTGVQFSHMGITTQVFLHKDMDWDNLSILQASINAAISEPIFPLKVESVFL